ncbi:hypothetical protein LEP1GSC100_4270 [Leptospira interrogans serovar Bataviae str. UI 08561]|nr:hypothetical protein LEP1GSC100_4270 [Leptospira interrogans serovar Bataviae str. UI 08561]
MGVLVYHNSGLLRPSAPLKTLGERNEKSRNQIRRNRLWKKNFRSHTDRRQLSSSMTTIFNNRNWNF